jgi:hypothetical protein
MERAQHSILKIGLVGAITAIITEYSDVYLVYRTRLWE